MIATVPSDNTLTISSNSLQQQTNKTSSFVPSLSAEHSIIDSTLPSDDSIIINVNCQDVSSSPSSTGSECEVINTNNELIANIESLNINECNRNNCLNVSVNQNTYVTPQQIHHMPPPLHSQHVYDHQYSCSPYTNELSCNITNGIYATNGSNPYEYDMHQQYVPQPQQTSPYYIYQYSDYAQVAAVNVAQTATVAVVAQQASSQSQQSNANNNSFYNGYQSIPYIYDPNMGLATNTTTQYSQTTQPSSQQHQAILSSPQHQSTILASYQTPPQTQHQLYINPGVTATTSSSNMTSPSSISPCDVTPSSNTSNGTPTTNDQCNSPQTVNGFIQQIQQTNTSLPPPLSNTYQTPYALYYPSSNNNPFITPQAYQSPISSTATGYLMYPPPSIQTTQINPTTQLVPPYTIYPNIPATPNSTCINQKNIQTTPSTYKQNRYNNNNRSNRYNKRYHNNRSNIELTPTHSTTFNKLNMQGPASVPSNDDMNQQNIMYHVDENTTPLTVDPSINQHLNVNINSTGSYGQLTPSMCSPATMCSPIASTISQSICSPNPYDSYYDPGLNHPLYQGFQNFSSNGLPYDYDHSDITTYGDEYDENYDE